jgi:hypothetical protein
MSTAANDPASRTGVPASTICRPGPVTAATMIATMVWIAVAGLLAVSLVVVVVDTAFAGTVRGWLDYPFSGVPPQASVAAEIFAHNLRALAGVLGALIVAQAGWRRPGGPSRTQQIIQRLAELVIAGAVAANIIMIGASVGAYGQRMLAAMLPHGPVELAGDVLALALYWQGRRRQLALGDIAAVTAISVVLLAVAAALETFA